MPSFVRNLPLLWRAYKAADQWSLRPSDYLGFLDDSIEKDGGYYAFCFDEACTFFGDTVSLAMEQAKGKTDAQKRGAAENILRKYLGLQPKFRDIGNASRKVIKPQDRPDPPFQME